MKIITTITELRQYLSNKQPIAFVPTMGNLHAGHIDLTRIARERVGTSGTVVLSIFVNRLQFAPHEDFDQYPRTFSDDCAACAAAGVDIVFAPHEAELYPVAQDYLVEPSAIQHVLDGAVRPGHFRGVATVVLKLFNIVQPQVAVFGKKDYQQCRVLTNLVTQFNLPIEMVLADTVRADDGLALSSRNRYLTISERTEATRLHAVLNTVRVEILNGNRDFAALEQSAVNTLENHGWQPDYVAIRNQSDLAAPQQTDAKLVILAAARLGVTRLIDNLEVTQ
jgi:pantoate--beta-alanine ligase